MLKEQRNHHHAGQTLDALVEDLMSIVFGPPVRRMGRRRLIRLPRRQCSIIAVVNHWRTAAFPIARATASSSPASTGRLPTG